MILANGGRIIGHWPIDGYTFSESKALVDKDHFFGLAIDEDNEDEMTFDRVRTWVEQLSNEVKELF